MTPSHSRNPSLGGGLAGGLGGARRGHSRSTSLQTFNLTPREATPNTEFNLSNLSKSADSSPDRHRASLPKNNHHKRGASLSLVGGMLGGGSNSALFNNNQNTPNSDPSPSTSLSVSPVKAGLSPVKQASVAASAVGKIPTPVLEEEEDNGGDDDEGDMCDNCDEEPGSFIFNTFKHLNV